MVLKRETPSETAPWTVDDLIQRAESIMSAAAEVFGSESETRRELNVRLIRDYVVREFIPRPVRAGREGRFGRDHLVYLLALRTLLRNRKWSLAAIKASFGGSSADDLLNGILAPVKARVEAEYRRATKTAESRAAHAQEKVQAPPPLNPAQLLIQKFKAGAPPQKTAAPPNQSPLPASLHTSAVSARSQRKPENRTTLHVPLESGCEVVIDVQRMIALTPEDIESLGEALKRRLQDETAQLKKE